MCMRRVCHVWKVWCSFSPSSSLCLCMKMAQPCTQCKSSLHQAHNIPSLGSLVLQSECVFTSRSVAISPPLSHASVHTCVCRCDLLGMCMYVKLTLGVIFYHFSPHSLRQSLLRLWSLPFGLDWLTNRDLLVSGTPELGLQLGVLHLALRWVLGISSQVSIVSQQVIYFTKLSSQSQ